ncbi:hypothetical protein EJ04DRAFT_359586 [Polyplosphaeria fusca]|uniref:Uncharacterized protein n=1 Tax=Polyplosphaeria fusca TaxID=682080 RepID=A0A9P4QVN8_9PLEO|nr:hypothetical protein EJ04DRAFT_359586 [Polyplosphaeria fusca]
MPRSREDAYEPAYVDDRDLESGRRARYPPGPPPDGGRSKYEGYYSDNRDNRARPGRYADERYMTDRSREDRYRDRDGHPRDRRRPGAPVRKESKWQKEATDAFKTYALPVIKAEGGKFVTKQLGAFLANQGGKR